jgi:serine/threonine-protein kinase
MSARPEALTRAFCGAVLLEAGRQEEAEAELSRAVATLREAGLQGPYTARVLDALGDAALRGGRPAEAVTHGREAVVLLEAAPGEPHSRLPLYRTRLGAALWASGRREEGVRLLRDGVAALESQFPEGHFDLATARLLLGRALLEGERPSDARRLLQAAVDWRQAHLGPRDPRTAAVRDLLAKAP